MLGFKYGQWVPINRYIMSSSLSAPSTTCFPIVSLWGKMAPYHPIGHTNMYKKTFGISIGYEQIKQYHLGFL